MTRRNPAPFGTGLQQAGGPSSTLDDASNIRPDATPVVNLAHISDAAIEHHVDPEALRLTRLPEDSEREILHQLAGVGL